ncbi:maleylpyruvate isomerase N-terminal domain-containing protein [Amycolatopsis suaedae]|uniref:Mycothiol-dependent maleylpyruvate isomerase metal-binding domain-containing protein n=1 Tax=Amycolatopsis suaedae TaxID=2510978 RepID=A0A4Q7J623_9PSEU|nr:maleylpyruvate isomerase N-terminal domain-containing protein [Amycolatopsis suaedae]RZQ62328.1 hypothetical protein EWH70_18815 [Amycolatopsis suaedae]
MEIEPGKWEAVRAAVRTAGDRFAGLFPAAPDPAAKVTADWSVADMAAHVTAIAWQYTSMVKPGQERRMPALDGPIARTTVESVSDFNEITLAEYTERDVTVLAERLRAHIDEILLATTGSDPATPVPWLGGARLPLAGVLAHLLNELLIHGRDIAVALGRPWEIPPRDAALFFELFLLGVIRLGMGTLLDGGDRPRERRIAVEFRSRYTTPVTLVLHRGEVSVEQPRRDNDIRLFFDPPTFNLVMFHRVGKPRAALAGKIVVWGRRPWLLPAFLRKLRMP